MIVCYAINDRASFENLPTWFEKIKDHGSEDVQIILVGNKLDLAPDSRVVSTEEEEEDFAKKLSIDFFEISALELSDVNRVFDCVLTRATEGPKKSERKYSNESVILKKSFEDSKKQKLDEIYVGCCF